MLRERDEEKIDLFSCLRSSCLRSTVETLDVNVRGSKTMIGLRNVKVHRESDERMEDVETNV